MKNKKMTNMYRDKKIDKKFKLSHVVKYVNAYIIIRFSKLTKLQCERRSTNFYSFEVKWSIFFLICSIKFTISAATETKNPLKRIIKKRKKKKEILKIGRLIFENWNSNWNFTRYYISILYRISQSEMYLCDL